MRYIHATMIAAMANTQMAMMMTLSSFMKQRIMKDVEVLQIWKTMGKTPMMTVQAQTQATISNFAMRLEIYRKLKFLRK